MRFKISLYTSILPAWIPVNYQYPLSAVIYRIIEQADGAYSDFLHNTGYSKAGSLKKFKLFTFSDLNVPFVIRGDRLLLKSNTATFVVCFHIPAAAENFIQGLFISQQIEIADKTSRAVFTVQQVESLASPLTDEQHQEMILQPLSPVVCGLKNERGNYDFLSPEHPEFVSMLLYNWKEKYSAVYGQEKAALDFTEARMEVIFYRNPPKSRLITIKAGTAAETRIRGFVNFRLKVSGEREALELLMDSGVGVYNSLGMGTLFPIENFILDNIKGYEIAKIEL